MAKDSEYSTSCNLQVKPVLTNREEAAFLKFPFTIYRNNPYWTPPLLVEEKKRWQISHNASLSGRKYKRFLAFRGRTVVGRIAASFDPLFMRQWEKGAGFFGFFECERDFKAAEGLLSEAERYLLDNGATKSIGPVNLTFQDEVGCLTEGFNEHQQILTPYNPSYYNDFFEASGYREFRRYLAFRWTHHSLPSASMRRMNESLRKRAAVIKLVLRKVDDQNWENEARLLHELYNLSFKDVWGFTPISWPEFLERTHKFRKFYKPELVLIAKVNGIAAGFGVFLPDINIVLKKINGRIFPFGWLKLVLGVPRLSSGRFLLLGVHPDYRGKGLAALISMEMAERGRELNFSNADLSLVDDRNGRIKKVIMAAGCEPYKTFKLYSKTLK